MKVARVGDVTDHLGVIVSGSPTVECDERPVARAGDTGICLLDDDDHPSPFIITSGSGTTYVENSPVAREGSTTSCGSIIVSGGSWEDNG